MTQPENTPMLIELDDALARLSVLDAEREELVTLGKHPMLIKLNEVHARLAVLDDEREKLGALIKAARNYERALEDIARAERREVPVPYRGIGGRLTAQAACVADELIKRAGRPVRTPEVLAELLARGLPVPDRNPQNTVAARLSVAPHLKGRRGLGWWPIEKPWPDERPA